MLIPLGSGPSASLAEATREPGPGVAFAATSQRGVHRAPRRKRPQSAVRLATLAILKPRW